MNNLPTKSAPYWWREKDGDEWETVTLSCHDPDLATLWCIENHCMATDMGGQWKRIPNPDEGQEALMIRHHNGESDIVEGTATNADIDYWQQRGFTCKPVTIFERDEE